MATGPSFQFFQKLGNSRGVRTSVEFAKLNAIYVMVDSTNVTVDSLLLSLDKPQLMYSMRNATYQSLIELFINDTTIDMRTVCVDSNSISNISCGYNSYYTDVDIDNNTGWEKGNIPRLQYCGMIDEHTNNFEIAIDNEETSICESIINNNDHNFSYQAAKFRSYYDSDFVAFGVFELVANKSVDNFNAFVKNSMHSNKFLKLFTNTTLHSNNDTVNDFELDIIDIIIMHMNVTTVNYTNDTEPSFPIPTANRLSNNEPNLWIIQSIYSVAFLWILFAICCVVSIISFCFQRVDIGIDKSQIMKHFCFVKHGLWTVDFL